MNFLNEVKNFLGQKDLAMDLGTANTLLYTKQNGIVLNEPSVLALDARTLEVLAVGKEAKEYLGRTPERIRAVRPMKDGVIANFDVTQTMIAYFIRKVLSSVHISKPRMVICVPTGITMVEKRAVIESAMLAGAKEVKLIEEPMAAAIGAGLPVDLPVGNMVVDIGGGTTEVAIISLSAIAYAESVRIAGDGMNEAIRRYMQNEFKLLIGQNMSEEVKKTIGSAFELPTPREMRVSGKYLVDGCPRSMTINNTQIQNVLKEPLQAIINAIKRAVEKTPPELVADVAEKGILLAGGGALLMGLDKLITKETNLIVNIDNEPLTTVVRGTGLTLHNKKMSTVYIN